MAGWFFVVFLFYKMYIIFNYSTLNGNICVMHKAFDFIIFWVYCRLAMRITIFHRAVLILDVA